MANLSRFGLPIVSEIGQELEVAAVNDDSEKVQGLIHHLANVTKFLKVALQS